MKSNIYKQAKYYEIAFSFVNAIEQVNLFEKFINKYSRIKVKTVLDICCGTAFQLREFAKRKYKTIGLDLSNDMLEFLKKVASEEKIAIKTISDDMTNFRLKKPVDFAYILMGSIVYTKNNSLFISHLDSVAKSLQSGGIYLIENLSINWNDPKFFKPQIWTIKQDKIKVKTTYQLIPKNLLSQIITQIIKLEVDDNEKKMEFIDRDDLKIIFPEEFKLLVEKNGKFEFLGFFEREKVQLLKKISSNNIALLRKK